MYFCLFFFFFKQKPAYEMRISDWSSDVCSSDFQSPEAFEPFLRVIKQRSDVVVNLTTGGSPYMPVEERVQPAAVWRPEVASLNMGSMNFGLFPMLKRYKEFKHAWEPAMLEGSHDLVFRNSFKDIRYALETLNATGDRKSTRLNSS